MNDIEFMTTRANPGVDPTLSVWGWQIPVYLFLAGLVAGMMIVASAQEWKSAEKWETRLSRIIPILAMVLLSLGLFSLYLDLEIKGLKLNVIRLYMTFRPSSVISWGAWILLITYPCLALWFLGSISPSGLARFAAKSRLLRFLIPVRDWAARVRGRILVLNMVVGTCLGIYTGIFLSGMVARPAWHSGVLGPLFLISGISTGAALLGLFKVDRDLTRAFIKWDDSSPHRRIGLSGSILAGQYDRYGSPPGCRGPLPFRSLYRRLLRLGRCRWYSRAPRDRMG